MFLLRLYVSMGRGAGTVIGVIAKFERGDQEETVPLAEVEAADANLANVEWLAAYRYWLSK